MSFGALFIPTPISTSANDEAGEADDRSRDRQRKPDQTYGVEKGHYADSPVRLVTALVHVKQCLFQTDEPHPLGFWQ